ncbi:hypothetical protein TVAG_335830 [Trichomonas vaginalis G3]|uniref:Uncharacterized protein n=1 Tax=Trichomonas vaginalis (strain ATCC PRA-98 / G3) TaxID=412133 RepID=A2FQ86_TRIV3|nr:hypothetical protein TVAGG3_0713700 [Trichomonas vaginalis G3]EAX92921.1 hypothetical protein TVAG_335830 [Trichomonas vaginalis G3]KAI5510102.1 hypothetical protein TVAGG3_0713700 [Trichomonas vaginalis G3]|eukprot:XP_001305851.1 hypothetical protein [Trichomonas vaginalis G3]
MFNQIDSNLQSGIYRTRIAFLEDLKHTCEYVSRIFGVDSEIGLGFLTIHQLTDERTAQAILSQTLDEYKKRIVPIIAELELNIEKLPSNYDEFVKLMVTRRKNEKPIIQFQKDNEFPATEINLTRLQNLILKLPNDFDVGDIIEVVVTYEVDPYEDETRKSFKLNLNKCQPEMLKLLWHNLLSKGYISNN